jgi:hypothetical protein
MFHDRREDQPLEKQLADENLDGWATHNSRRVARPFSDFEFGVPRPSFLEGRGF